MSSLLFGLSVPNGEQAKKAPFLGVAVDETKPPPPRAFSPPAKIPGGRVKGSRPTSRGREEGANGGVPPRLAAGRPGLKLRSPFVTAHCPAGSRGWERLTKSGSGASLWGRSSPQTSAPLPPSQSGARRRRVSAIGGPRLAPPPGRGGGKSADSGRVMVGAPPQALLVGGPFQPGDPLSPVGVWL